MNFKVPKKTMNKLITMVVIITMVVGTLCGFADETVETDAATVSFEESISSFPDSYKTYLRELHKKYPNWNFVAYNTGIDFATAVKEESKNDKSLIENAYSEYLKSNASGDYNTSTGKYIPKDGGSWVTASKNCVAYFMDPRNFLDEVHIYMFEQLSYDATTQTQAGVEAILQGSFMYKNTIGYINTKGKYKSTDTLYSTQIMTAAKNSKVSAYYIASKILQEIGKTKHKTYAGMGASGSINGQYSKEYTGIYNFYNIGAYTSSAPIANGLNWAAGGKDNETTYQRPWTTPAKSINGGAQYIGAKYINCGQNTTYFQRFNVNKDSSYGLYTHQYMTNIYGAKTEGAYTYEAYNDLGITEKAKTFVIPVYENMPQENNTVRVGSQSTKTATVNSSVNLRQGPSTEYNIAVTLAKGDAITVTEGVMSNAKAFTRWLGNPYWFKVIATKNGKKYTGYLSATYVNFDTELYMPLNAATKLPVTLGKNETIYYMSDNPSIATVDDSGKVTGKKAGTVNILAFTSDGKFSATGVKIFDKGCVADWNSATLQVGEVKKIGITIYPTSSTNKKVTYKSSDSSIAKVSKNGNVTAKKPGTVTITVTPAIGGITAICTVKVIPKKPVPTAAISSSDSIEISWGIASNISGYYIYRKTGSGSYKKIATISGSSTSYTDSKLAGAENYSYKIKAYTTVGKTKYNSSKSAGTTTLYLPLAQGKITARESIKSGMRLRWNAVPGASGYKIYRSDKKNGKYTRIKKIKKGTTLKYTDKKAVYNKKYYYKIRAYKVVNGKNVYGAYSSPVSAKRKK